MEESVILRNSKGVQTSRSYTNFGSAISDSVTESDFQTLAGIKKIKFVNLLEKLRLYLDMGLETPDLYDSDQLLLCLMMYRTKFDINFVSKFFNLDKKTTVHVFAFWTRLIYKYLKTIPFWRLLEFSNCSRKTIILQVNSVSITPNRLMCFKKDADFVISTSTGKVDNKQANFKYLVALSDKGHVIFCSEAIDGRYLDNNVVRASKVVDKFENEDIVLSQTVIHIDDLLQAKNIIILRSIATPVDDPFLAEETVVQTAIKNSNLLRFPLKNLPSYLIPLADEIVYNMNMLTNFKSVIMKIKNDVTLDE